MSNLVHLDRISSFCPSASRRVSSSSPSPRAVSQVALETLPSGFATTSSPRKLSIYKLKGKIDEHTEFGEIFTPGLENIFTGLHSIFKLFKVLLHGCQTGSKEIMRDAFFKIITASASFIRAILEITVLFIKQTVELTKVMDILGVGTCIIELLVRFVQLLRQLQFDSQLNFKEGNSEKTIQHNMNQLFKEFFLVDATKEDRDAIEKFTIRREGLKARAEFKMKRFYRRIHCKELADKTIALFNRATYENGKIVIDKKDLKEAGKIINAIEKKSDQIKMIHTIAIGALILLTIAFSVATSGAFPAGTLFLLTVIGTVMIIFSNRLESALLHTYDKPFDYRYLLYKRIREFIWSDLKAIKEPTLQLHVYTVSRRYKKPLAKTGWQQVHKGAKPKALATPHSTQDRVRRGLVAMQVCQNVFALQKAISKRRQRQHVA